MNKRDKLIEKLRDALKEDKTLQGDLGIQEVEEVLLFLLEEDAPRDNVLPEEAKIRGGTREKTVKETHRRVREDDADGDGVPVERAPAVNKEHVQPKPGNPDKHLGNPVDETENADEGGVRNEPFSPRNEGLPPTPKGDK